MHLLKGMSKKRHTRAPYEIHNLEGMVKKDISILMRITKLTSVALSKGQGEFLKS
jgi:hypothetical protein